MIPTNPQAITLQDSGGLTAKFSTTLTPKIMDYLRGNQLGSTQSTIDYWTGPMVPETQSQAYADGVKALLKSFTPINLCLEVCERRAEMVLGDEPAWNFTPRQAIPEGQDIPRELQSLIDEAEQAATVWWDAQDLPSKTLDLTTVLIAHGRAPLRFFFDPMKLRVVDGETTIPAPEDLQTLEAAMMCIRLQTPSPTNPDGLDLTSTGVYVHPDTLQEIGVWRYRKTENGKTYDELELSWSDGERTYLKLLRQGAGDQNASAFEDKGMLLGGRLWVHEWRLPRGLITDDLIRNQNALNVANTMIHRNTYFAGFVERYGIGVQPPGKWVPDPDNPGQMKFEPVPFQVGAGSLNLFQPATFQETTTDANGNTSTSEKPVSAQYGRFEPSAPAALTAAIQQAQSNIYDIARQRFVLMGDDATASGRSREVATGDHLRAGARVARVVEGGIRGILEFVLAVAADLLGRPEFNQLRATVQARPSAFTPTPQEREQNRQDVAAGLLSQETARSKLVADVDAESQKVLAELNATPRVALEVLKQGGPTSVVLQGLLDAGVTAVTPEMVAQQKEIDFAQVGMNQDAGQTGEGTV